MSYPPSSLLEKLKKYARSIDAYLMKQKEFIAPSRARYWSNAAHGEGRDGKWKVTYPNGASYVGGLTDWGTLHLYGELSFSGVVYRGYWKDGDFYGKERWWEEIVARESLMEDVSRLNLVISPAHVQIISEGIKNVYRMNNKKISSSSKDEIKLFFRQLIGDGNINTWANSVGTCKFSAANGALFLYMGRLSNSKPHGNGKLIPYGFSAFSGKINLLNIHYVGEFRHGNIHGQGTMIFPDGAQYEGNFKHNKFNGRGKYTFADGLIYNGYWEDDKFVRKI